MTTIFRKSADINWQKIGDFIDIDDADLPGVKELKEAQASIIFDFAETDRFGAVFEKWPPVKFDWHYECDEMFYILSGGPIIVTCDGDYSKSGVERFILDLSHLTAVHGICKVGPQGLQVDLVHASSNLLIRGKADLQGAVGN